MIARGRLVLDADDLALWERIKAEAVPLRPAAQPKPVPKRPEPERAQPAPSPTRPAPPAVRRPPAPPQTLERGLRRRLKRGSEAVGERLDLHGLRQEEAHRALLGFLRAAQARGTRVVLVITGRSRPDAAADERGVLRRAVPQWLGLPEFRPLVQGLGAAEHRHGGGGALYVLLRRAHRM